MNVYSPGIVIEDRYEVAGRPLLGGMGIVYLCYDQKEQRPVALKTFQPQFLSDRATRDRFLREGTTWVDLGRHPNIVHCYNVIRISDGSEVYLELEMVAKAEGRQDSSLRSWLTPGQPLSVEQTLLFSLQIVRGMKYATEKISGFVHRDLKPENVLVGADRISSLDTNRLRVTDFGLVNILQATDMNDQETPMDSRRSSTDSNPSVSRTQLTHGIVGTPLYMAPEQWMGEKLGVYTDIYALGCILVEMLTGKRAVLGDNLNALEKAHCDGQVQALPRNQPKAVRSLVERCLQLNPGARYRDWGELEVAFGETWGQITTQELPAAEASQRLDREERVAAGWAYNNLGYSYLDIGKADVARGYFEHALVVGQAEGERHLEAAVLVNLGIGDLILGDTQRAIGFYKQALEISREIANRRGVGAALGNLGNAYLNFGDISRAIAFHEQHLEISREIGNRHGEGNALGNLGNAYRYIGDDRNAISYLERALVIHREIKDRRGEGTNLSNLGSAYFQLGDAGRAISYHKQALEIFREIGDRHGEGAALGNLGSAYGNLGDVRRSINFFEQQLKISREIGDQPGEGNALWGIGNIYFKLGSTNQSIEYYEQALVIHREIGDKTSIASISINMAKIHAKENEPWIALPLAQEAALIYSQIGHTKNAQQAQQLVAQLQGDDVPTGGTPASNSENLTQQAFEAFQVASSAEEMSAAITEYSFMTDVKFIAAIEQFIVQQVHPEHKSAFEQRLDWLRKIAEE